MVFSYHQVQEHPKLLLAMTSLAHAEFYQLLPHFQYAWEQYVQQHLRLSRFKLAGPPTPRDTEASNAYAIIHDALGPVCICSLIGINSYEQQKGSY